MNPETGPIKPENEGSHGKSVRFNDIAFRLIVIPLCGIAIPLFTGMIDATTMSLTRLKLAYLYTIGIAWVIFHGNRYLLNTLRSYVDWHDRPYHKVLALVIVHPFFTVPVSVLLLVTWYYVFEEGRIDWPVIRQATLIIMLAVVFIVHLYETVFLVKEAESDRVRRAELDRARTQAELDALRNQIDPHFMFNSLNTLSALIEKHPDKAMQFNDTLAGVYRYVLSQKSRDLVFLSEELGFLTDYFSLMRIRFGQSVLLDIRVSDRDAQSWLMPPISLQLLAENAIKHNEISPDKPLILSVYVESGGFLVVHNPRYPKRRDRSSPGIGLDNLDHRYRLLTGKGVDIIRRSEAFEVRLPLIRA